MRLLRTALLLLAALCVAWAILVFITGGFYWSAGALRISSRDPFRPIVVAVMFVLGYGFVTPGALLRLADTFERIRPRSGLLSIGVAVVVVVVGLLWASRVAGAADPYGYMSEADLWLRGQLKVRQTVVASWPYDDRTLAPLGYLPGPERHTIVPTYPPGLPLLMAAGDWVAGSKGRFWIVPLTAAVAVLATFMLGALLVDELVGLAASLLLGASPVFLYQLMWPMNDVPVTAAWTIALVLAVLRRPFAAGIASALAIVIRPNLLLLTMGVGVLAVWPSEPYVAQAFRPADRAPKRRATVARSLLAVAGCDFLLFAAGVLPAIVGIALLNTSLYGGPLSSGYGTVTSLYHWMNLWPNIGRYSRWLIETNTPLMLLAIPALASARFAVPGRPFERRAVRAGLAVFVVAVVASYLFYSPFEDWTYLRFMLPAFPVLLVASLGFIRSLEPLEGLPGRARHVGVLAIVVALAFSWELATAQWRGAFSIQQNEQRYEIVARELLDSTPANSIFLSMQHAGSVRYYAGRMTIRYDWLPQGAFDQAVGLLKAGGFHTFLLLESAELEPFRARVGPGGAAHLAERPLKQWSFPNGITVWLYDLADPTLFRRTQ